MDHLSSCYFCGAAMDHPLQRYRVVPVELRDDDDVTTATLCPSCHRKLERLLAPVVEAVGTEAVTLDTTDGPPVGSGSGSEGGDETTGSADSPGPSADVTGDAATDTTGANAGGDAPDRGEASEDPEVADSPEPELLSESEIEGEDTLTEAMEPDVPEELASGNPSATDAGRDEPEGDDSGAEGPGGDEPEPDENGEAEPERDDSGADEPGVGEPERSTDPEGGAVAEGGEEGAEDTSDGGQEEPDSESTRASDATARTTVSALEYNKVMRLLQNREFPVERAEIETVAANAYGLARSECASVIDLAIDRGLIEEDGGQLVRPD